MEEKVAELQDYLSNKQQHLLAFTSNESEMSYNFPVPLKLNSNRNYKAALLWFSAFNTIFNIIEKKNNQFAYEINKKVTFLSLPPGAYEINQINMEIQRQMQNFGHPQISIGIDKSSSRTTINIPNNEIIVHFNNIHSIKDLLGFNSKSIGKGFHRSDNIVQITNISTINIECNIIQNSYINGKQTNIIYSFPSYTVPVGYKIIERVAHPIYLPLSNSSTISNISLRIVDEKGKLISFNGEEISMAIELKQV